MERTSHVQDIALGLLCKLLLRNLTCVRNNSSKLFEPPIDTAGSDEPLSGEANLATSLTNDRWSCLGQLFLLATEQGNEVTVKIFKHVKTLAKFGSLQLREALFTKVIFPFVLKYKDMRKVNALSQVYKKLSLQVSNPYDSGYGTPNESCDIGISQSEDSCTSQQPKPKTMISDDALRISLTSLLALLETDRSQRLFLNSGGVESIINFLGDESLNPICLGILEMLAEREERNSNSSKRRTKQDDSFKKRNHEMVSENRDPVVVNILLRLMFLLDPTKKEQAKSDSLQTQLIEFASKIRLGLTSPKVSGLLCQLWRSCLQVLRRNAFFRDLFVHSSGPSYVVVALKVVKEYLHKMDVDYEDNKDQLTGCVKFMERAAAVGLEFEEELVDSVQVGTKFCKFF